eukprot:jgi/Galph1/2028/GphlegSOOS_G718.1
MSIEAFASFWLLGCTTCKALLNRPVFVRPYLKKSHRFQYLKTVFHRRPFGTRFFSMAAYREEPPSFIVKNRNRYLKHFSDSDDTSLAVAIDVLSKAEAEKYLQTQPSSVKAWLNSTSFFPVKGKDTKWIAVPSDSFPGKIQKIIMVLGDSSVYGGAQWMGFSCLASAAPAGLYKLSFVSEQVTNAGFTSTRAAFAWALGSYSFQLYKGTSGARNGSNTDDTVDPAFLAVLIWPKDCDRQLVDTCASATFLVRDLISTPAEDMGPAALERTLSILAEEYPQVKVRSFAGEDLLTENFPQVYLVGRGASTRNTPRVLEMIGGDPEYPKITIVGKGVCFDSGGLDIKPASGMRLMKKDMGGAAHAIGLASMILSSGLPVQFRVIISAVENAVDGESYRPGDILKARNGMTTEVGNTDAEGRLILADALVYGCESSPELVVDFATLTGAARVALGTDLPVFFCSDEQVAQDLLHAGTQVYDPVWRLPLYSGYRNQLDSRLADIKNIGEGSGGGYGGAILAALYLKEFVIPSIPWIHFDIMAYNLSSKPGKPEGGEAMGMRCVFQLLQERYGKKSSSIGMI